MNKFASELSEFVEQAFSDTEPIFKLCIYSTL